MLAAPFFHVGFADFWLADQLNSLVTVLLDLHFLVCFYISNGDWLAAGGTVRIRFITRDYFYSNLNQ